MSPKVLAEVQAEVQALRRRPDPLRTPSQNLSVSSLAL
jgi:hypothetical protein